MNNSELLTHSSTLLSLLPKKPWCSFDKQRRFVRPAEAALSLPYIQINHPQCARSFAVDLDTETLDPVFPWESADLPAPSYAVFNPVNGHVHLIWILNGPVFAKSHEGWKLRRLAESFKNTLSADKSIVYQMNLVKNPLHEKWKTMETGHVYTLDVLEESAAEHLVQPEKARKSKEELQIIAAFGRNCGLFDVVRKEAYSMVKSCKSENELRDKITSCLRLFNFSLPNPYAINESDMRSIPKSISKWTWAHRHGFGNKREDTGKEEKVLVVSRYAKQSLAAMSNKEKVLKAVRELRKEGKKISSRKVEAHMKKTWKKKDRIDRTTIRKYLPAILALDFPLIPYRKPGALRAETEG